MSRTNDEILDSIENTLALLKEAITKIVEEKKIPEMPSIEDLEFARRNLAYAKNDDGTRAIGIVQRVIDHLKAKRDLGL